VANVAGLIVVWCTLCVPQHGNVAVAAPPSTSNRIDRLILIGVGPVYICNMMQLEGRFYCIQQNFGRGLGVLINDPSCLIQQQPLTEARDMYSYPPCLDPACRAGSGTRGLDRFGSIRRLFEALIIQ
jgi:hypothetical protein